jgi:peptidoglycan/LPS O-acetylase OafA/YrhL
MLARLGDRRLDYLDQIRALAVLMVIISHYAPALLPGGGLGVGIFFALSGFLIATILLEIPKFDGVSALGFVIRRFARIYPAYVVSLLAGLLLAALENSSQFSPLLAALPSLLTFTNMPQWMGFSVGILWTLQVEMLFYISLPIAMLMLGRRLGVILYCTAALALSACALALHMSIVAQARWAAALAFGALLSLAWKSGLLARLTISPCILVALGLAGIIAALPFSSVPPDTWAVQVMVASLSGCALIAAFLLKPEMPVVAASALIGRISYSMYLVHGIVIDYVIPPPLSGPIRLVIYAGAILLFSALSYWFVEKPGIRFGKRLTNALFHRRAVVPAIRG